MRGCLAAPCFSSVRQTLQRYAMDLPAYTRGAQGNGGAQLWIIDPHGNLVLRYDPSVKGKDVLNDLRHLLKLSNIG